MRVSVAAVVSTAQLVGMISRANSSHIYPVLGRTGDIVAAMTERVAVGASILLRVCNSLYGMLAKGESRMI